MALVSGAIFVVAGLWAWWALPAALLINAGKLTDAERVVALATNRQSVLLAFGGLIAVVGVIATVYRLTYEHVNTELQQDSDRTDRFARAIDQLGSERPAVQNGGIYALARVAKDSPNDSPAVGQVLAAFVRTLATGGERVTEPERSAILALASGGFSDLDLGEVRAAGLRLREASFVRATLGQADLSGVNLDSANLTGCEMLGTSGTNWSAKGGDFDSATLSGCDFHIVDFTDASFRRASIHESKFAYATLTGASFRGATLWGVDFSFARIKGKVDLKDTDLWGEFTILPRWRPEKQGSIDLEGASWKEANGTVTNLEPWAFLYDRVVIDGTVTLKATTDGSPGRWIRD